MASTSTTWITDTNTKSGTVQVYESNVSVLKITGVESGDAVLDLFADQGDDNADKWRMWSSASDNDLHFSNYTSGAWVDKLKIADGGTVTIESPLHIGTGASDNSGDAQVLVTRVVTGSSGNAHCFSDSSDINRSGTIGYNSFDARINIIGSNNYDHYAGFQYAPTHAAGTITNMYGIFIAAPTGGGTITNNYGIYAQTGLKNYFGGNVGIGTTAPNQNLTILQNGSAAVLELQNSMDHAGSSDTAVESGDILGEIIFSGNDSNINSGGGGQADNSSIGARIRATADGGWGDVGGATNNDNDSPARLAFYTQSDGNSDHVSTERLTIKNDGKIGVNNTNPDTTLAVDGTFAWGLEPVNQDLRNCVWHGCNSVVVSSTTTLWNVRINHTALRYGTVIVEYRIAGDASDRVSAFGRVVLEHNNGTMSNQALSSPVSTGTNVPTISVVNDNTGDGDNAELGWDLGITKTTQNFTGTIFFTIYFGNGGGDPQFRITAA